MNLRFLGDALDHWKGSIISHLLEANLLDHFAVDPMATDFEQWGEVDRLLYSRLLRVTPSQLVLHKHSLVRDRKSYFSEVAAHSGDLFLDPDTGICTNRRPDVQHLKASELHSLLDQSQNRIILVYQHVRAKRTHDRMLEVFNWLRQTGAPFCSYSYESPSVAMLFFSRQSDRLDHIGQFFSSMLDWHVEKRFFQWH